ASQSRWRGGLSMSRPFRCSARPTARKPTARTTIAMIAQITTRAVSHIRGHREVATDALLRWSLFPARNTRQRERNGDGRHRSAHREQCPLRGELPPRRADRAAEAPGGGGDVHGRADASRAHARPSRGDANVIRNAGGSAREALGSLVVSQRLLGTREVANVSHTDCGLLGVTNEDLREKVRQDLGADASAIDFLPFSSLGDAVRDDVRFLRSSPLIAKDVLVRGFIYDVKWGQLREVE